MTRVRGAGRCRTAVSVIGSLTNLIPVGGATRSSDLKESGNDGVDSWWARWESSLSRDGSNRPLPSIPGRSNDPVISVLLRHRGIGAKSRHSRVDRDVNRIVMIRRTGSQGQLRVSQVTRSSFS